MARFLFYIDYLRCFGFLRRQILLWCDFLAADLSATSLHALVIGHGHFGQSKDQQGDQNASETEIRADCVHRDDAQGLQGQQEVDGADTGLI